MTNTQKPSIGKNYILNLSYQILTIIIPVITMPYISRVFGATTVGLQSYAYSYVSYFLLLAALGTTTYAQREIARIREDKVKRTEVFWELFLLRLLFSVISTGLYLLFCFRFVDVQDRPLFLVQIVYIISCAADITWLFQGIEDFGTVVIRNTIVKLVNIIFIFLFVKSPNDLVLYVLGLAGFPMIANVLVWISARKYIVPCSMNKLKPMRHFKGTFALFIPTIASQVYMVVDKTMLGIISPTTDENGYYEQAEKIVRIALTIYSSLGAVVMPRVASLYSQNKKEEVRSLLLKSTRFMWMIASALFWGLISISYHFVPWYLGSGFSKASLLIVIFSWLVFAVGLSNVVAVQFLVPIKKQNIFTISVVAGAIINLVLNAVLIPMYLSVGAAFASIIAETLITSIQVFYSIRVLKIFSLKDLFNSFPKYFLFGAVMGIAIFLLSQIVPTSFFGTMMLVLIGSGIYIMLLVLFKDSATIEFLKSIKRRFRLK